MANLVSLVVAGPITTTYEYDELGNRIRVENLIELTDTAITSIEPRSAVPGQRINLYGRNLPWQDREFTMLFFGDIPVQPIRMSDRVMTVEIPEGVAGDVNLTLAAPGVPPTDIGAFSVSGIVVTPGTAELAFGETVDFDADLIGLDGDIVWKVGGVTGGNPSVGTIDASGVYTAPLATDAAAFPFDTVVTAEVTDGSAAGSARVVAACSQVRPLGVDAWERLTIGDLTEVVCHTFEAASGGLVSVFLNSNRPVNVAVLSPAGRVLVSTPQTTAVRERGILVLENGEHRVYVSGAGAGDPAYSVGVLGPDEPNQARWVGGNADWFNPESWSGGAVPTPTTDVVFDGEGGTVQINGSTDAVAKSVTVAPTVLPVRVTSSGARLTSLDPVRIETGGELRMGRQGATEVLNADVINEGTFSATRTMVARSATVQITGSVTNEAGGLVRVFPVYASNAGDGQQLAMNLRVDGGLENRGLIELSGRADRTVSNLNATRAFLDVGNGNGIIMNFPGGEIVVTHEDDLLGTYGIKAGVDNAGTVRIERELRVDPDSGGDDSIVNTGTFRVTQGRTTLERLSRFENLGTVELEGGEINARGLEFTTSGSLVIAPDSALLVDGGVLSQTGGTVDWRGTVSLSNATLNYASGIDTGVGDLVLDRSTVNGTGVLSVASGDTLTLNGSTLNMDIVNRGVLRERLSTRDNISSRSTLNGSVSNEPGGTILLSPESLSGGFSQGRPTVEIDIRGSLVNNGLIELTGSTQSAQGAADSFLVVTDGTLLNTQDGEIRITQINDSAGSRGVRGNFDNLGLITVERDATLGVNDGDGIYSNSGTLRVLAGLTRLNRAAQFLNSGTVSAESGDIEFFPAASGGVLETSGVIDIRPGSRLTVRGSNGTLTQTGGELLGGGTLELGSGTLNLAGGFDTSILDLVLDGTTVNGPGVLTVASGDTLTLNGSTLNMDIVNRGVLRERLSTFSNISSRSTLNGSVSNEPGGTILLSPESLSAGFSHGQPTVEIDVRGPLVNNGLIELTGSTQSTQGAASSRLDVTDGTLLNTKDGEIRITQINDSIGSRSIDGGLRNEGTINVGRDAQFNASGTVAEQSGTIAVTPIGTVAELTLVGYRLADPGRITGGGSVAITNPTFTLENPLSDGPVDVLGTVSLSGTATFELGGGYAPQVGDVFGLVAAGSVSGTFSGFLGTDLGAGLSLLPTTTATSFSVSVTDE